MFWVGAVLEKLVLIILFNYIYLIDKYKPTDFIFFNIFGRGSFGKVSLKYFIYLINKNPPISYFSMF